MRIKASHRVAAALAATAVVGAAAAAPAYAGTRGGGTLQSQVNAIYATGDVAGVLAAVTGPRGTAYATAGQADTATGAPVLPYDEFRIGSASKTFLAVVVLQLVAEGRVSLDDTVEHWLPGVVDGDGNDGSKITIRDLLQHTSGIYNYTGDFPELASTADFEADRYDTYTPEQLVAIAMRHKPDFAPGTAWEYSNTNYVLAGMIVQKVTGRSWEQEVDERVIEPLGLRHTTVPGADPYIAGPHLHGYSSFGTSAPPIDVTVVNMTLADAAGEIVSTTADLTRFYQALIDGRLLPKAQLAEMETTVPAPGLDPVWPGVRYGLGLMWIPLSCGGGYYSHGGDVPGYSTRDGVSADGRHAVVVERTGDGSDATSLATEHAEDALVDQQLCAAP